MKRLPLIVLLTSTLLTALMAVWLFKTKWTLNSPEWPTKPNPAAWPAGAWLLPISVVLIFGGLAAWSTWDRFTRAKSRKEKTASTVTAVIALSLVSLLWPWSLLGPTPGGSNGVTNLVAATWSDVSSGYFSAAYRVEDARTFAREYADKWQNSASPQQAHVATHPPGTVLFYYTARRVYEAVPILQGAFSGIAQGLTNTTPAEIAATCRLVVKASTGEESTLPDSAVGCALWCCFLVSLATALTIPAVYLLGAGDNANERRGLLAAAFYALAPMVGLFTFGIDAAIACGATWGLVLCARRIAGGKPQWMAGAGVILGLTSFLSFGAMAAGVIVVLALLLHAGLPALKNGGWKRPATDIALFGAGFLAVWLVLVVLLPMQPLRIYNQAMATHHIAAIEPRTYSRWVWMNIVMYALFAGWPVLIASLLPLFQRTRELVQSGSLQRDSAVVIGQAAWLAILVLSLSGKVRGEVERLWMFLLPPICALAAYALLAHFSEQTTADSVENGTPVEKAPSGKWITSPSGLAVAMLTVQSTQTLMMVAALAPLVRP